MTRRALVLVGLLLAGHALVTRPSQAVAPTVRLAALALELGAWHGRNLPPFDPEIVRALGADDLLNRVYVTREGAAVGLYVAHYRLQRSGDAIHSPRHCLPGNGWEPVSAVVARVEIGGASLPVNRFIVQKGERRQLVLYWFQGRGRTIASEYANRLYLAFDALRDGRSDGALVRIIAPLSGSEPAAESAAERAALDFLGTLHPHLARWIP